VESPAEEAMEAIGETGDTLTGIVSVLIDAGMEMRVSAVSIEKHHSFNTLGQVVAILLSDDDPGIR